MWRSGIRDSNSLRRSPEALERIEGTGFRAEYVHDEVEVVEQHPSRTVAAFDVRGLDSFGAERFLDGIRDGLDLARILAGHDHEIIGEPLRRAEIEHHHVAGLAIVPGVDRSLNLSRKLSGCAFAWRCHRTAATGAGTYKWCRRIWPATLDGTSPSIDSPAPTRRRMSVDDTLGVSASTE